MGIERLERWLFVKDFVGWIEGRRCAAVASATCKSFNLPSCEVYEVAALPLTTVDVESHFDLIALVNLADELDLILEAFELNVLRVFVGFSCNDEGALVKATAKSLFFKDFFYGSG